MSKYYDLSVAINGETLAYPGDPGFVGKKVCSQEHGQPFNVSRISMNAHLGTHIDFPCHFISGAKTSSDYPIDYLIGEALLVEVPADAKVITAEFVKAQNILKNDIVFFKTASGRLRVENKFVEDYVCFSLEAAEVLVERQVKIVGIDYLSVDAYRDRNFPVHHKLLDSGILIVENLDLTTAPLGRGKFYIAPLKVTGFDGSPARVIFEK